VTNALPLDLYTYPPSLTVGPVPEPRTRWVTRLAVLEFAESTPICTAVNIRGDWCYVEMPVADFAALFETLR
jgi:hypothetical protein